MGELAFCMNAEDDYRTVYPIFIKKQFQLNWYVRPPTSVRGLLRYRGQEGVNKIKVFVEKIIFKNKLLLN